MLAADRPNHFSVAIRLVCAGILLGLSLESLVESSIIAECSHTFQALHRATHGIGPPPLLLLRLRGGKPGKRPKKGGGGMLGFNDLGNVRKLEGRFGGKAGANKQLKTLKMDDLWEDLDELIDGYG
jgi:hypothetical protein